MNQAASIHSRNAGVCDARSIAFQRWGALLGGGALAVFGLTRRSKTGLALAATGGVLAYMGTQADAVPKEFTSEGSLLVNCSPQEVYQFWRNFENLPLFTRHLETVTVLDNRQSRWVALGPLGIPIHWDAEIVSERENESIAWRSLPGSDVEVDSAVQFRTLPGKPGTLVTASVRYRTPSGQLTRALAKLLGKSPKFVMRQDLRRFKALVETGEIPTTEGQPHGPRSTLVAVARVADPDRPIRRDTAAPREVLDAMRRVS